MVQSLTVSGTFNVFTDIYVEALSQAVTNDGSVEAVGLEMQLDFRRKQNESLLNSVV